MNKEKLFTFSWAASYEGAATLIAATVSTYFAVFMTDTIGIPAATASIIMFIATLWDAVNDPIMGAIADRTHTKFGRYRPYFLFFPALFAVVSTLLFVNPQFGIVGKVVYTTVFYILWGMLLTVIAVPWQAVLTAHVKSEAQRNKAITVGAIFMALAFTIASSFTPNFLNLTGGSYVPLMIVYGVLTVVTYWTLFRTSEEKYLLPVSKRSPMEDMKVFFKHKELLIVVLIWIMAALGYGLMFGSSIYYITYYYVRPDLIGKYMLVLSIGALLSMMFLMGIMLKLFKNSIVKVFVTSQAITLVCYVVLFFFGKNSVTLLFVGSFLATLFGSMEQALINILVNDTVDYVMLKENITLSATISALKGFAEKCGRTLSNSGILAVLSITGYIANAVGQQPESALFGINLLRFGFPAISCIIIIICLVFYPISKHYDEIKKMKEKL